MVAEEQSTFGARLRQLRETAGLTQADLAERAGLTTKGIAALERGRRQRPYPHTVAALAQALGLSDAARAELLGSARRPDATALPAPAPEHHPLPLPPTPLVGRDAEVAALIALVRAGARLITLIGPGGVGKTRLALAVAIELALDLPDGAAFVPLAPLSDPTLVLPAVAEALGLRRAGGQPIAEALRAYLCERQVLIVLDNCEHLLEGASEIAALLAACPGLTILATSRAPLRLRGEREYPLAPLAPPDLARLPTVADIAGNPAVQLFVSRARDVAPDFALVQADAAVIAAICRRLDGLPLALELAAARVRFLRPTDLLARLDRALPLLAGGPRDLSERQRTMRDTIAWSYDLLGEEERALFRRLAVFAGGWNLAAAEAVAPEGDVLGPLSSLVEQSLVVAATGDHPSVAQGESRYRMLATVREFALEQLVASGEGEAVRRRHAGYVLALAERAAPELAGPDQVAWLARLDREHDNVRAAMTWALATGSRGIAVGLGWALHIFWSMRGHHREGRRWLETVLAANHLAPPEEARALAAAGMLARMHGDYPVAIERLSAALTRFRDLGDTPAILTTLSRLGHAARLGGDYGRARALAEEGLALAREVGDLAREVWMLDVLGLVALAEADYDRATAIFEAAVALLPAVGDTRYLAGMQANLAAAALGRGDHREAAARSRAALEVAGRIDLRRGIAINLDILASVAAQCDPARAARLFGAAEALREVDGLAAWSPVEQALYGPYLQLLRPQLGDAAFAAAWAAGRALSVDAMVADALAGVADEERR